jgi:glycine betaine/choline ABC-type transport system substrate-binding protein
MKHLRNVSLISILSILAMLAGGGCSDQTTALHVGSKTFTEQLLVAEMVAQLAEHEGVPVKRSIPYGETSVCAEGLRTGDLDLYVEYTGTGLLLLGQQPLSDAEKAYSTVQKLFAPLGLEWQERLGFYNNYELVTTKERAAELEQTTISALNGLPEIRLAIATTEDWVDRPLDGLAALKRRYGMENVTLVETATKTDMYRALLNENADVAVGYSTDAHIPDYELVVLADDLDFFPVYEPAPLVRQEALERFPDLKPALHKLAGLIDLQTMQQLNRRVELQGEHADAVAHSFLVERDLLPDEEFVSDSADEELGLALGNLNKLSGLAGNALNAARQTFPNSRLTIRQVADPAQAVIRHQARIGMVSAEAFFHLTGGEGLPRQETRLQAVGAVGYNMLHIIASRSSGIGALQQMKSVGTADEGGASHQTARIILNGLGLEEQVKIVTGELEAQIRALRQGELDGLMLLAPVGNDHVTKLMKEGGFRLLPLQGWQEGNSVMRFPFLRLARIPAESYAGQNEVVDTVSSQVVLVGPAPQAGKGAGNAGPVAIAEKGQPLADAAIVKLHAALGTGEVIDPTLPSAHVLRPGKTASHKVQTNYVDSGANAAVILVLIYMLYLFFYEEKRKPEEVQE